MMPEDEQVVICPWCYATYPKDLEAAHELVCDEPDDDWDRA